VKEIRVLFISKWYPSKLDPMPGLFVERHARAVSGKCNVCVLYIQPVNNNDAEKYKTEISKEENFTEIIVYYNNVSWDIPVLSLLGKVCRYHKAYKKGFHAVKKEFGSYDLIHVNILTRTGIVAYLKKLFTGIPYIITEHWSRYLPITNTYKGCLRKWLTGLVVKNASAVTTVTNDLKNAMISHKLNNKNYHIVPNVVDTALFNYHEKEAANKKTILHVSCFEDRSKNISGMLRVLKKLSEKRQDFICRMVGDGIDKVMLENYAKELGILNNYVVFEGLKESEKLAEIYSSSDFMLLFSNYENMPVVIAEAFASGLAGVSTDVGGIAEVLTEDKGILVKPKDEAALENAVSNMLDNYKLYDKCALRQYAIAHFSNKAVGEAFNNIYKEVVK
jgi:glycosyltransferase involved in cell wall biosynthesis